MATKLWHRATQLLLPAQSVHARRPIAPNQVLRRKPQIATGLEDAAGLERPGHLAVAAREEKPHLEGIADDPVDNDAGAEAAAPFALPIGEQLGQRQRGFDSEGHHAEQIRVRDEPHRRRHEDMQHQQHAAKVRNKRPVRPCRPPLPEVVGPPRRRGRLERQMRGRRPRGERNMQQHQVHGDHEQGLDEQRGAKVRAEPVEHLEDAGDEHDERNVEREAGAAARAVHRVDLVAIAGDGAGGDAGGGLATTRVQWARRVEGGGQNGRNVLHHDADEAAHGVQVQRGRKRAERRRISAVH